MSKSCYRLGPSKVIALLLLVVGNPVNAGFIDWGNPGRNFERDNAAQEQVGQAAKATVSPAVYDAAWQYENSTSGNSFASSTAAVSSSVYQSLTSSSIGISSEATKTGDGVLTVSETSDVYDYDPSQWITSTDTVVVTQVITIPCSHYTCTAKHTVVTTTATSTSYTTLPCGPTSSSIRSTPTSSSAITPWSSCNGITCVTVLPQTSCAGKDTSGGCVTVYPTTSCIGDYCSTIVTIGSSTISPSTNIPTVQPSSEFYVEKKKSELLALSEFFFLIFLTSIKLSPAPRVPAI